MQIAGTTELSATCLIGPHRFSIQPSPVYLFLLRRARSTARGVAGWTGVCVSACLRAGATFGAAARRAKHRARPRSRAPPSGLELPPGGGLAGWCGGLFGCGDAGCRTSLVAWVSLMTCRPPGRSRPGRIIPGSCLRQNSPAWCRLAPCCWGGPSGLPWPLRPCRRTPPGSRSS